MTNTKSTKRALLSSAIALVLCVAMLIGSTYAWFTDSVVSGRNTIQSGNLDVELYWAATAEDAEAGNWTPVTSDTDIFGYDNWEPGYTKVAYFKVANEGSLALKYQFSVDVYNETAGVNVHGDEFLLSDYLTYGVVTADNLDSLATRMTAVENATNGMSDFVDISGGLEDLGWGQFIGAAVAHRTLLSGEENVTAMVITMPTTVGNEANHNGKDVPSIEFGINLVATQKTYEEDDFGDDYDENATLPVVVVKSAEDLKSALTTGGNLVVMSDITLADDESLTVPSGVTAVLDLNGNTVTGTAHKSVGAVIRNNGNLTIKGGVIESTADNGGSAVVNNGSLTVSDATLNGAPHAGSSWPSYTVNNTGVMTVNDTVITSNHGAVASYGESAVLTLNDVEIDMAGIPGFTSHAVYTYSKGKVVINGGEIVNNAADQNSTGGSAINGDVTVTDGYIKGRIEKYYGTPVITGGTFTANPTDYVVSGYSIVKNEDGTWTVSAVQASTKEELQGALEEGKAVELNQNIENVDSTPYYGSASTLVDMSNGGTIDGNGNTIAAKDEWDDTYDTVIYTTGGTIKNVTIDGAMRGIFSWGLKEDLYIDNVVFNDCIYTLNDDASNGFAIRVTNSVINGWTSYTSGHSEVSFTNCSFGEGMGYAFLNAYNPTTFTNCDFAEGYEINPVKTDAYLTFINCTYNGVAITAENIGDVLYAEEDAYLCKFE